MHQENLCTVQFAGSLEEHITGDNSEKLVFLTDNYTWKQLILFQEICYLLAGGHHIHCKAV